jgi:hypothetical protein
MDNMSFDEWFDIMAGETRNLGYAGIIDRDSFQYDWEENLKPKEVARDFVKEMNS